MKNFEKYSTYDNTETFATNCTTPLKINNMIDLKLTGKEFQSNATIFSTNVDNEMIKLCDNGDILVKGKLIENDKEVVDAMREFLKTQGYLNTDVSQQREPLLAYHKHLDSFNDPTIYNASESMIDDYLANNCG